MTLWISSLLRKTKNERSILVIRARLSFGHVVLKIKPSGAGDENERRHGRAVKTND